MMTPILSFEWDWGEMCKVQLKHKLRTRGGKSPSWSPWECRIRNKSKNVKNSIVRGNGINQTHCIYISRRNSYITHHCLHCCSLHTHMLNLVHQLEDEPQDHEHAVVPLSEGHRGIDVQHGLVRGAQENNLLFFIRYEMYFRNMWRIMDASCDYYISHHKNPNSTVLPWHSG